MNSSSGPGVWSVTLSGPGEVFKNVSFNCEQPRDDAA
jgi:hypothetical protein